MFLVSVFSICCAAFGVWLIEGIRLRGLLIGVVFLLGCLVGNVPRIVGGRVDPWDSYGGLFERTTTSKELREHAWILVDDCLPRLISGHRLPGFEAEPPPANVGAARDWRASESNPLAWATVAVTLPVFMISIVALAINGLKSIARSAGSPELLARGAVSTGLLVAAAGATAGFIMNKNIYNSDNYRYLIVLLIPWALGFGVLCDAIAGRWRAGKWLALALAVIFAAILTADAARWYQRFGWIRDNGMPIRRNRSDPALAWLNEHPDVVGIFGGYWDVYRLSFLTAGRVKGVPFPIYPNRFPDWSEQYPGRRPRVLLTSPLTQRNQSQFYQSLAESEGGRVLYNHRGLTIIDWP